MPQATLGALVILVIWIVIAIATMRGWAYPPPPTRLKEWTSLFISVAVAATGARALWVAPKQFQDFINKMKG